MKKMAEKEIRVFISSTFKDMIQERDIFMRQIVPRLSMICRKRGGTLTVIDLRWGITQQEAENNQVLKICLDEIDRCRPYFIGILGDRYGWTDYQPDAEMEDFFPFISNTTEKNSITHLEIIYGALGNHLGNSEAVFFIRNSEFSRSNPEFFDTEENKIKQLQNLKDQIIASQFQYHEYDKPINFAEKAEKFLMGIIDEQLPEIAEPTDIYEQLEMANSMYCQRLLPTEIQRFDGTYQTINANVGLQKYFQGFKSLMNRGAIQPVFLFGNPCTGKSLILSNFADECVRNNKGGTEIIQYYADANDKSSNIEIMLSYLIKQISQKYDIRIKISTDINDLINDFPSALYQIPKNCKCILIIDGTERLNNDGNLAKFAWLPSELPENVRMLISADGVTAFDEVKKRGFKNLMQVILMDKDEIRQYIKNELDLRRKQLNENQMEMITNDSKCGYAYFLSLMLNELCVSSKFEDLDDHIQQYLQVENIVGLLEIIFTRWENDFDEFRENLTKDMMSYLYCSKSGLFESELLQMLGRDNNPFPSNYFARLRASAEKMITESNGMLQLSNSIVRWVVESRYIQNSMAETHRKMADFFIAYENSDSGEMSDRTLEQIAWHLYMSDNAQELNAHISKMHVCRVLINNDMQQFKKYWSYLESKDIKIENAYDENLKSAESFIEEFAILADVIESMGYVTKAVSIRERLLGTGNEKGSIAHTAAIFGLQASALSKLGDFESALEILERQEDLCQRFSDTAGVYYAMLDKAVIYDLKGNPYEAERILKKCCAYFNDTNDIAGFVTSMQNLGTAQKNQGRLTDAMNTLKQCEELSRKYNRRDSLINVLGAQALVLKNSGKLDEALDIYNEVLKSAELINDRMIMQLTLGNIGVAYRIKGEPGKAVAYNFQKANLCRSMGMKQGLVEALANMANCFSDIFNLSEAWKCLAEAEGICREEGYENDLQMCLSIRGNLYTMMKSYDEALEAYAEQEKICDRLRNRRGKITCLASQAIAHHEAGDIKKAKTKITKAAALAESSEYPDLIQTINNISRDMG